ncbi:NAD-specific glutamate dehydrogenase [Nocardia neocaledoniensis NBRC 108232]|uniref:Glutamate dehydrogenase n=1 Tax=Nocardia neocaledoniensis TaxID=236511 RepID=A0A317N202_9NOCA|nr:NAD-glutamate dehydrogenase [Nocardia neocaledoniensis]PWV66970.1 glutamate dehydrogenase [Nocardia neocaledoniensis]GEM31293.1 NAD-specific glutamate dehydrogenase [Nocardia neocaledoniensis NBRC 108232]
MVLNQHPTSPSRRPHGDPGDPEAAYFRWLRPGAAATADRAQRIFRNHRALATVRAPGASLIRVYRPADGCGLGTAVQIVIDDMPLLVNSVSAALRHLGVAVGELVHPVFDVDRDETGRLRSSTSLRGGNAVAASGNTVRESWMHVQLAAEVGDDLAETISSTLSRLLADLSRVADDTHKIIERMHTVGDKLAQADRRLGDQESGECARLLHWLTDGHFTLLGYGYYQAHRTVDDEAGAEVWQLPDTGLGVLANARAAELTVPVFGAKRPTLRMGSGSLDAVLPGARDLYFISVADAAPGDRSDAVIGNDTVALVKGEHVFVGTFTVTGLHEDILDIPVISRRALQVIEWSGVELDSYSGQAMLEMMQSFPRVELFSTDARRLYDTVSDVMNLGLRRQIRLFLRHDERSGAVYCLVYMPRDRYSSEARQRMSDILRGEFQADRVSYSSRASESELAVLYFTVHRGSTSGPVDVSELRRERIQDLLFAATVSWIDQLLAAADASDITSSVVKAYIDAFPAGYQQDHSPARALADLRRLERLRDGSIDVNLFRRPDSPIGEWRLSLFVTDASTSLSRVLPVLHSLGVEVLDERPYRIRRGDGVTRWLFEFRLHVPGSVLQAALDPDLDAGLIDDGTGAAPEAGLRRRFPEAFEAMWFGRCDVDPLNELVVRAGLDWRQVTILRAYAKYLKQGGFAYTSKTIARVLLANPAAAKSCVELFTAYFDPDRARPKSDAAATSIVERLQSDIDEVLSLETDRILRAFLTLITATVRTNYFRRHNAGGAPSCLSLKLEPRRIDELPWPRPHFEIFVYAPWVEGVHLRFGSVARGGLRWSDRQEDYRTEILGLVKAQAVKNSVIVPVGAKGGFVVKRPPVATGDAGADRAALSAESIRCYRAFIAGMLDITDNIDRGTGAVVPPARVVRRDGDDTYLVVAADKGTATFSDIANEVAADYDFWLGDAFASGGSAGYDHKQMGITARGAWESVKRHFREMDVDVQTEDFTVAGIGDMSGDVFGNGMLLSEHIRLVAAFDHRHIFLDPEPDAARSFQERLRVFGLPRSSWADYDRSVISAGGGVFDRSAKSVVVSPQIRAALGIESEAESMAPAELIRAILTAPVDLLWNGGIGTYIKASDESDAAAGDKANDAVRIDAKCLRAKVIGEGGNLGATARGRIEYSRNGGRINTDALDNSAGVDCSDHEVNIKVLLDMAISTGDLAPQDRNPLLASMTTEVGDLVLADNIAQNVQLGLSRSTAGDMVGVHRRLLTSLEQYRGLDRDIEGLPTDTELAQRAEAGTGLSSPELATLMAHVKLALKADLLAGDLPDSPAFAAVLPEYFPEPLRRSYMAAIRKHPLRREIIATVLVNEMVDDGGITFAFQLGEESGASTEDAVRAFAAAVEILDLRQVRRRIRAAAMPTSARDALELELNRTLDRAARWLLTNRPQPIAVGSEITRYRDKVAALATFASGAGTDGRPELPARPLVPGAPEDLEREVSELVRLCPLLDVIDVADIADRDPAEAASLYAAMNDHFEIDRLVAAVGDLERGDRWRTLARLAVRDDLHDSLRMLTLDVLTATEPEDTVAEKILFWQSINRSRLHRVTSTMREIFDYGQLNLATLSVAARQVRSMVRGSDSGAGPAPATAE